MSTTQHQKLTAAVIGLGNIGMQYDNELSPNHVLTHCNAFAKHEGYSLLGAVDPCPDKRKMFETKYQLGAFETIEKMLEHHRPMVVAFCVPHQLQAKMVLELISHYRPKAVLLEKPVAATLQEAENLAKTLDSHGILACVNYIRRFEPGVLKMRDYILSGKIGKVKSVVGWYFKSLKSNGCHIIDLMNFIFSNIKTTPTIHLSCDNEEHVLLNYGEIPVHLFLCPNQFVRFELEFIGDQGAIAYLNNGREIIYKNVCQDEVFKHIHTLQKSEIIPNDLYRYQWHVQDALYQAILGRNTLNSTLHTALLTEALIERATAKETEV